MNEPEQKLDIRQWIGAAGRRRKWIILSVVLGLTGTAALAFLLPAYYRSSGTILIEQQELPADLVRSTVSSYADQRIQVIGQRVMTTKNLLDIIQRYDLYADTRQKDSREKLIARMRNDIKLNMISADVIDPRSGMPREATIAFSISYTSRSPSQAQRVANELTTLYLSENITERTRLAQDASSFLEEEAKRLSTHITELEAKLAAFKEKNGDSLPELSQLNMQLLDRTEQDLRQQEARLTSLDQQRVYLEAQLAQIKPNSVVLSDTGERIFSTADRVKALRSRLASARAVYSEDHPDIVRMKRELEGLQTQEGANEGGSSVADVQRRLDEARAKRNAAREKYAPEHPDSLRAEREVVALEDELAREQAKPASESPASTTADNPAYIQIQAQLEATRNEQAASQQQISRLRAQMLSYQKKISTSPQTEKEYRELARDYANAQLKYQEIRAKQMEAQVAQNLETDRKGERFSLIEPPLPPEEPVSPNRVAIWLVGVILSLGLAVGVVALLETVDATVRNRKDLIKLLSEAPLALIPSIPTEGELRAVKRRLRLATGAACVAAISAVLAVHLLYRPMDVLWFQVLRKFGF